LARSLAQAYNQLGQHQRAREVCQHTLEHGDREQLGMPMLSLGTQLQLALAESGLGQHQRAEQQLKQLFAAHLPRQSAITLAMLHDAGAQLALARNDLARAREHHTIATVLVKSPGAELERDAQLLDDVNHMMKRVQLMLSTRSGDLVGARARSALQVALELSSAN
jgi:hypothetical protein